MKWLLGVAITIIVLAFGLSVYLQPNSFALCPFNNGEPTSREGCHAAEALVVVSGGDTPARTKKAVEMFNNGWAPRIIFSGAAEDKEGPSNAAAMRLDAIKQGVPANAILIEEFSENTSENAEKTRDLLMRYKIQDIILITSGYHQRRASLEFAAYTKGDKILIRNAPTNDRDWGWWWWLTPRGWILAVGEFIRIVSLYATGVVS
jgi:uncharacterized SAM-binding protein YcdF (DUF218 family)